MRLLALADIHGRFAAVDAALEKAGPIDVLILAGDITTNGTPDQVERVIQSWRPRVPHLFAVAGNMDSPAIDEKLEELGVSLNGQCQRIGEVAIQAGSTAVRDFIDRVQPGLVLCGHIHEARGQARLGSSVVVNCGPARSGHYVLAELTEGWRIQSH